MTTDSFGPPGGSDPAQSIAEITPADEDLAIATRAIYVGGAGNLKVTAKGGQTATFANLPAGALLPVRAIRVWDTGTTATDIVALW